MGGIEPATAACRLDRDGTLTILVGTVDLSGTNTAFAQIAADAFGVPVEDIRVVNGDSESAPYAGASGGSKITYTVGAAVERAAREARRQLLAIAADRLEAAAEDLELVDRAVRVRGMPDRAVPLADLAKACMQFGAKYEPVYGRGSSATITRSPAFAAHLAEVEVDLESGAARVVDHLVVQDVGRAINPAAIEGQIQAGVSRGRLGAVECMAYDESGQPPSPHGLPGPPEDQGAAGAHGHPRAGLRARAVRGRASASRRSSVFRRTPRGARADGRGYPLPITPRRSARVGRPDRPPRGARRGPARWSVRRATGGCRRGRPAGRTRTVTAAWPAADAHLEVRVAAGSDDVVDEAGCVTARPRHRAPRPTAACRRARRCGRCT
jgi:hypothetical protein